MDQAPEQPLDSDLLQVAGCLEQVPAYLDNEAAVLCLARAGALCNEGIMQCQA